MIIMFLDPVFCYDSVFIDLILIKNVLLFWLYGCEEGARVNNYSVLVIHLNLLR